MQEDRQHGNQQLKNGPDPSFENGSSSNIWEMY